jgi:hypothetical protein
VLIDILFWLALLLAAGFAFGSWMVWLGWQYGKGDHRHE